MVERVFVGAEDAQRHGIDHVVKVLIAASGTSFLSSMSVSSRDTGGVGVDRDSTTEATERSANVALKRKEAGLARIPSGPLTN